MFDYGYHAGFHFSMVEHLLPLNILNVRLSVFCPLCCFLPCKGTYFSANHNNALKHAAIITLFLALQKYKFFGTMDMFRGQWAGFVISYCPDFANA